MNLATLFRTRLEHLRNERRTRAQIEALQLKKFRRLVRHAAKHAPYYREIIAARSIDVDRCVPQDFPVLTKDEAMASFDRIVTDHTITRGGIADFLARSKDPFELYQGRYHVLHTSGTSGEVGYFVHSRGDWARGSAGALRFTTLGLGKQRLAFFGASEGPFAGISFVASMQHPLIGWAFDLAIYEINAPLGPTIDGLNAFQPTILRGYASALAALADKQLEGRLSIAPRTIESGGELVLPADCDRVERAFGVPIFDVYSSSEHLIMGLSRPEYDGVYLFEDNLIFEIEPDHTLVTNLFNYTLPLVRYRMNDVLVPVTDEARALPFTKVQVVGRSEHMPVFVNEHGEEDFISPHTINEFLVKNVSRFQLNLEGPTACVFRICLRPGMNDTQREETLAEVRERFGALLAQKEMRNVDYRIEVVDDLPVDPKTGKFRLIVPPMPPTRADTRPLSAIVPSDRSPAVANDRLAAL